MKVLLLSLPLSILFCTEPAQNIFRPFKGQREITKVRDIKPEEVDIANMGEACGDYFLYQEIKDEKIISFKVPVTAEENRIGTTSFLRLDKKLMIVQLNDKQAIPTAEVIKPEENSSKGIKFIIRISGKDYESASCLPRPR